MAFRRKDVKKASYYVWFLGAKESKGLRGDQYVVPVLRFLLDRERQYEPSKVTLQVSNKGIKIVQTLNVPRKSNGNQAAFKTSFNSNPNVKTEQIKHMIPHHSVTWVSQEEDIICCIMLIYNPITKCPVHVHAYRCDSIETATTLRNQLQILIDRPENQKKFREIEMRLAAKGLMPTSGPVPPELEFQSSRKTLNSDGRSTRTEGSDNTDDSLGSSDLGYNGSKELIKNRPVSRGKVHQSDNNSPAVYESLAAELRAKLGNPKTGPILLPPRDYDTISRKRGKLEGIELRKSTNQQIVGPLLEQDESPITRSESSGKSSSGIGSDEALSSAIHEIQPDYDQKADQSSSDDDWGMELRKSGEWLPVNRIRKNPIHKSNSQRNVTYESKYKNNWSSERDYEWDKSLPTKIKTNMPIQSHDKHYFKQQQHHQQHQSSSKTQPKTPQRFYFPDPAFKIPDPEPNQSRSRSENRLQRRKSNPDCFRSASPVTYKSDPLQPTRYSHIRYDNDTPQKHGHSRKPEYYYGKEMPINASKYIVKRQESAQQIVSPTSNRHHFVGKPIRRISAFNY